ncbi:MAG: hypothetical protein U1E60_10970 [Reyranellaceae bacterium]
MSDHPLDRAVAPNLFDVVAEPGLVFTLVLANLMSPHLWSLRDRIASTGGGAQQIQEMLDHHFEHVTPARVADMNGVFDLDDLARRYGAAEVEYAVSRIASTFEWRVARGTRDRHTLALDLIAARKFPAYTYATIDEAWACRRLLQRRKHKPWGLTCCLDEAALFAALHLAVTGGSPEDVVILGAPTHYSVLVDGAEGPWWFYSKHELHAAANWSRLVADSHGGSVRAAFDERLPTFDRIVTAAGTAWLDGGESSIAPEMLDAIVTRIDGFFGGRLAQLDRALQRELRRVPASSAAAIVGRAAAAGGADAALHQVRRAATDENDRAALQALHAFRTLDVPDPSVYLQAARHGSQLHHLLPVIGSIDDALRAVDDIAGTASIFDDQGRIAMPDETVRFATGTHRDKALLLHVLLERHANEGTRPCVETLLGETDSYVRGGGFCISLSRLAPVAQPEQRIVHRLARSA